MNIYSLQLTKALQEIDKFSHSEAGSACSEDWYRSLKRYVRKASDAQDGDGVETLLDAISSLLVDSGPVGIVSPSIIAAHEAMEKTRRQRFIDARHKA